MRPPLGNNHSALDDKPGLQLYRRLFGIEDYHSHFRWKAIKRYVDFGAKTTLEVGTGSGLIAFEVARRNSDGLVVASEFDEAWLSKARQIAERLGVPNVEFSRADLRSLALEGRRFDQVLAIDVLEHIDDHEQAIKELAEATRIGGKLVLSVPNPNYPLVMGRKYHEAIGHVRDGYWIEDLKELLEPAGFVIDRFHYYTGRTASWACSLMYRRDLTLTQRLLLTPPLLPLGYCGEFAADRDNSISLAVSATRAG